MKRTIKDLYFEQDSTRGYLQDVEHGWGVRKAGSNWYLYVPSMLTRHIGNSQYYQHQQFLQTVGLDVAAFANPRAAQKALSSVTGQEHHWRGKCFWLTTDGRWMLVKDPYHHETDYHLTPCTGLNKARAWIGPDNTRTRLKTWPTRQSALDHIHRLETVFQAAPPVMQQWAKVVSPYSDISVPLVWSAIASKYQLAGALPTEQHAS